MPYWYDKHRGAVQISQPVMFFGVVTLERRKRLLRGTPLFLIVSEIKGTDGLLDHLASKAKPVTVRRGCKLKVPDSVRMDGFAICNTGCLTTEQDDGVHWLRKSGDFWFLAPGTPALVASVRSTVLCLPRAALSEVIAMASAPVSPLIRALAGVDFLSIMRTVPFFATLGIAELASLAPLFTFEAFEPSAVVYATGEPSRKFYILVSGRVDLTLNGMYIKQVRHQGPW